MSHGLNDMFYGPYKMLDSPENMFYDSWNILCRPLFCWASFYFAVEAVGTKRAVAVEVLCPQADRLAASPFQACPPSVQPKT